MRLVLLAAASAAAMSFACVQASDTRSEKIKKEEARKSPYLNTPEWLTVRGSHRTRFEAIDGPNQLGESGGTTAFFDRSGDVFNDADEAVGLLAAQTSIFVEAKTGRFKFGAEIVDARSYNVSFGNGSLFYGSRVGDLTNAIEPLQGYVTIGLGSADRFSTQLQLGRFTMDLGSSRLVARSDFRNVIQSYYGARVDHAFNDHFGLTAFYTVLDTGDRRHNTGFEFENQILFDKPDKEKHFFGVHSTLLDSQSDSAFEAYVYGFNPYVEGEFIENLIITPGLRFSRPTPSRGWGYDVEGALQFYGEGFRYGDDERSMAGFLHAEFSSGLGGKNNARLTFLLDFASGENNNLNAEDFQPSCFELRSPFSCGQQFSRDGSAEFTSLFGDFSNDFGPEGLYGAFDRSNLGSLGVRYEIEPNDRLNARVTYRAVQAHKALPISFRPVFYGSDGFALPEYEPGLAHQLDFKGEYELLSDIVSIEFGGALLTQKGSIEADYYGPAPSEPLFEEFDRSTTIYGYTAIKLKF